MTMNPSDLPDRWPPNKKDLEEEWEPNLGEGPMPEILAPPIADMDLALSLAMEVPREFLWERCVEAVERLCVLVDLPVIWTRSVAQIVVSLMGETPVEWIRGVPLPNQPLTVWSMDYDKDVKRWWELGALDPSSSDWTTDLQGEFTIPVMPEGPFRITCPGGETTITIGPNAENLAVISIGP